MRLFLATSLVPIATLAVAACSAQPADGGASASAAGDRLAIAREGIVLIDPDGGNQRVLTRHRGWVDYQPAWSPDQRRIAFTRTTDGYRSFQIFVKPVNGGPARRLTDGRFDERPAWSPDGRLVAYQSMDGIKVIRPDGSGRRRIRGTRQAASPAWSPDGGRLAFSQRGYVWTAKANGRDRRRVARGREPDWSPDGKRLAYTLPNGGVATVGVGGSGRRLLGKGMEPAWSPDGRRIAFGRWPENEVFSVWVMRADGSSRRRVARHGMDPAWRPVRR